MGLKKGMTNNPNGRKSGIPNKITSQLRELITEFLNENFELVKTDFNKLDPKDRIKIYFDIVQYAMPKYQSLKIDQDINQVIQLPLIQVMDQETKKFIEDRKFFPNELPEKTEQPTRL